MALPPEAGEDTGDKSRPERRKRTDCFHNIAKLKRVYKIEMNHLDVSAAIRTIAYIDLMAAADPARRARKPLNRSLLICLFFGIKKIGGADSSHRLMGNDVHVPFSNSCVPREADDSSVILVGSARFWRPIKESGGSASARWPPRVVVKSGWLVGYPFHKRGNFRMRLQGCPVVVTRGQFAFAQGGVNFSMADAVNSDFDFAALTAWYQVVFVHAGASFKQPAAQRAKPLADRQHITQRLGAAQRAFGNHE